MSFGAASDSNRKSMIAKIHIGKSKLCMVDESYRALLVRITGKESTKDMSGAELEAVLKEFERLGFKTTTFRAGPRLLPNDPQIKRVRALWLNLYHLGAIHDGSEKNLEAYCLRMAKVEKIQWMRSHQIDAVIRGLLGWLNRIGWMNPDAAMIDTVMRARVMRGIDSRPADVSYGAIAAKAATIYAQYRLLGKAIDFQPEFMDIADLDKTIEDLGVQCRAQMAAGN